MAQHESFFSQWLKISLEASLEILRSINSSRLRPRTNFEAELSFIAQSVRKFVWSRNKRASERLTSVFKHALILVRALLKHPVYRILCVDGRISPVAIAGLILWGSVRVPAGNIPDFVRSKNGKLYLPDHSYFARLLELAFSFHDTIVELLDSHRGCAAAEEKGVLRQGPQIDNGLLLDVIRKLEIKYAIEDWVERYNLKHKTKKRAIVIHISSEPGAENQNIIIGLRKDECISRGEDAGGFSQQVLDDLLADGHILSTKQLLGEAPFADVFDQWAKNPEINYLDWGKDYPGTALRFWTGMEDLLQDASVMDALRARLTSVLPYLSKEEFKDKLEAHQAILLACMANTFFGTQRGHTTHQERIGFISYESEFVPFDQDDDADAFMVHAEDPYMDGNLTLTLGLMRQLRQENQNFPGVFMVLEVISENHVDWRELDIDWSDLVEQDWLHLESSEFLVYLQTKNLSLPLALAIDRLRKIMVRLYDPRLLASRFLIEGDMVALAAIADSNREVRGFIPFFVQGYRQ